MDPTSAHFSIASRRVAVSSPSGVRLQPARIEISGPYIEGVQTLDSSAQDYASLAAGVTHDFDDMPITPAFVNGHTHLALVFLRGASAAMPGGVGNLVEDLFFHYESRLSAGDVAAFTRMGAYESLLNGVGLVWDHYYFGEAVADACAEVGLSAVVSPTLQDLSGPGAAAWERNLEVTERLAREVGARGIWSAVGPHATDTVSAELMEQAITLAERDSLPVHLHVAQSLEEVQRVEAREGRSPLSFLERAGLFDRAPTAVLAHGLFASKAELAALTSGRHALAVCPASQAQFGFPARVDELEAAGVPWLVATDCAASNDAMSLQKELRWCAAMPSWVAACTPEMEAVWTAAVADVGAGSERAARLWEQRLRACSATPSLLDSRALLASVWDVPGTLHPAFRAGMIGDGMTPEAVAPCLANLVVWNPDHPALFPCTDPLRGIAYGESSSAIHGMWVLGKEVGNAGAFAQSLTSSEGYRDAVQEARARLDALMR